MTRAEHEALPASWVDLESASTLPSNDRAFYYGDSVFETMRYHNGEFLLLARHLKRLALGCETLGILHSSEQISHQLSLAVRHLKHAGIEQACARLTLTRGSGERGYAPAANVPRLALTLTPVSLPWGESAAPARVMTCSLRLALQPLLAGIKHGNRLEQVLAAREVADRGLDEGLLLDATGQLVSAVSSNLFLLLDNGWVTPGINACGVRGTARDYLLDEVGMATGIAMTARDIAYEELDRAEGLFICNSLQGIRAVSDVDGRAYPLHPQILALQSYWFEALCEAGA